MIFFFFFRNSALFLLLGVRVFGNLTPRDNSLHSPLFPTYASVSIKTLFSG